MPRNFRNYYRYRARHYTVDNVISIDKDAIRARDDVNFFTEYISGLPIAHEYQEQWASAWVTNQDNDLLQKIAGPNINFLAPRGASKSTRIAYAIAWTIGHNPGIPILYISYSSPVARSRSRIIKRILENPRYSKVFPHIRPNKEKWADSEWEIDKRYAGVSDLDYDFTLYAVGMGGAIASKRSWLIVVDDPIKNRTSILNPLVREKIRNNWRTAALPTLLSQGRILSIGTRYHKDDIHVTDLCPEKGILQIEQPAIITNDDGTERSYWEAAHPYQNKLIRLASGENQEILGLATKRELDPTTFAFQMQNTVVSEYDVVFDEHWIQWSADLPDLDSFDTYAFGMDLAAREREMLDFTAIVLLGLKGPMIWVLDAMRGRWPGNLDKIDALLEMAYDWQLIEKKPLPLDPGNPNAPTFKYVDRDDRYTQVFAEEANYQVSLQADWRRIVGTEYRLYNLRCVGSPARGDKAMRLKATTGKFQKGQIMFNEYRQAQLNILVKELINFGADPHDDLADAFAYGVNGIVKRSLI